MLTAEALIEYGFKRFPPNHVLDRWTCGYQFCVRDSVGKRLFVNVRYWDSFERIAWDAEVSFDLDGEPLRVLRLSVASMAPAEIVDWFSDIHAKLGCDYYEKYE